MRETMDPTREFNYHFVGYKTTTYPFIFYILYITNRKQQIALPYFSNPEIRSKH